MKRKRKYHKRKVKKSNNTIIVLFIVGVLMFLAATFFLKEEIKYSFLKIRATYIVYKSKYTSKTENEKIQKIISSYKNKLFGIDISHYQGIINWNKIEFLNDSIPIHFVLIRATAGKDKSDKYFTYNWRESKNNFYRGAYHYYRPNENSTQQANNYINKVQLSKNDFPPILDIENLSDIQTTKSLIKGVKNWLKLVEEEYNITPIIYTGDSFYKDNIKGNGFSKYPIWIANYNKNINKPNTKSWIIWQFSDQGKIDGIGEFVDLNVFDGNNKKLRNFLKK